MQDQPSLCLWELPKYLNLSSLDLESAYNTGLVSDSSWQSNREPKQCRQGKHTHHERGQTQCGRDTAKTHHCHLFAGSLPHHRTTEQVRLKKCPPLPPCGRADIRHWVQFSRSVVSDFLRPHELQHARPPCPSPTPGVHSDSRPSSRWCHPAISSSVVPFSSCPQSLPASESFPMSQLFARGGQSTGVSALASFFPKNTQGWSPLEWKRPANRRS